VTSGFYADTPTHPHADTMPFVVAASTPCDLLFQIFLSAAVSCFVRLLKNQMSPTGIAAW